MRQELRGDAGQAAQALQKVVALVPSDADAQYNLGVSHLQMADNLVSPLKSGSESLDSVSSPCLSIQSTQKIQYCFLLTMMLTS